MKEAILNSFVGIFMVASNFVVIILIIISYLIGGMLFEEMTTAVAIITPLFAGYTTIILKYVDKNKLARAAEGPEVSANFVAFSVLLPILFTAALLGWVGLYTFKIGLNDFEVFKYLIGVTEALFGVYLGQFVYGMFTAR